MAVKTYYMILGLGKRSNKQFLPMGITYILEIIINNNGKTKWIEESQ